MHKAATEDILKSVIVETDMGVQNGLTHTRLQPKGNIRTCTVKHSHPSNPGSYIYSCAILFWERRSRGFCPQSPLEALPPPLSDDGFSAMFVVNT